jgi:hypothetical protein
MNGGIIKEAVFGVINLKLKSFRKTIKSPLANTNTDEDKANQLFVKNICI